ncbi:MAG TPA: hotdog domain-containing protein [Streptosporangiaceae bacterium]|nr:hotdog domain-containing protein [Streptosporangiaceae bacterium]
MLQDEARRVLERLHEAQNSFYQGGGPSALLELLAPDVVWQVPGDNAIAGDYHGIDAVMRYFARRRDLADRTFRMTGRQILCGDDGWIGAVTDGFAVIDGQEATWSTVGLYQVRDGRIAACRLLPFDAGAFDAIWTERSAGPAHTAALRVPPRLCDAQGMVHAGRYYELFEDAFLGWLDEHVGGYRRLRETGTDLVVVASGCDHAMPAHLDDQLTIEARPVRRGRTSLTMSYLIRRPRIVIVTGRTTYVAVAGGRPTPLPDLLTEALSPLRPALSVEDR